MNWYNNWHNHPHHQHAHLLIFFSVLFIITAFLFVGFLNFHLEKNNMAAAQTPCSPSQIFPNIVTICDISPKLAKPGDIISISGSSMGNVIQLTNDSDGTSEDIIGNVNSSYDLLSFTIPSGTPDGIYGISIASTDGTTVGNSSIDLTIAKNPNILPPQPPPVQLPFNQPPAPIPNPPAADFQDLISNAFNYSIMFVGIAIFIMILWAGFLWLTSTANPGNIATAKGYISSAIFGGILLLSAYVILYTINPELVGGEFNLGGIKTPSNPSGTSIQSLIALDEFQAASAITAGCIITTDQKDFTAINCPLGSPIASGLIQDPIIKTMDINANNQVGATTVQNNGNQGSGIKIIILDTGYNYNHPELSSSYLGGKDFINNDGDPMDDHTSGVGAPGHGSHVAGIITADGIDPKARGVAPQAGIIAGKILDRQGEGKWSYMTDAIYWAVNGPDGVFGTSDDFKADLINISVGGGTYTGICDNVDETTRLLAKAIQYAKDNGVLVIISSGNVPNGVSMPGCIDAAFTVGAVDSSDRIAYFSGRGSTVDIVAPGVNIYSTLLGSNYGTKQGTSMATPIVSGVAALIKSAHPEYNPRHLEQVIVKTAKDLGSVGRDNTFGWGRVTADAADSGSQPLPPTQITTCNNIQQNSAIRGGCENNYSTPVIQPNANLCADYCGQRGANACEWNSSTGDCYAELGSGCYTQSGFVGWSASTCQSTTQPLPSPSPFPPPLPPNVPPPTKICTGNMCGRMWPAVVTCTKGTNTTVSPVGNLLNCDVILDYETTGAIPSSYTNTALIIKRNGINWKTIPCLQTLCSVPNGTQVDSNPLPGTYTYTLHLGSTGAKIGSTTVYIYSRGTIRTNFGSCTKKSNPSNQNCDITLNISAQGSNSIIVTKDGVNWRIIQCVNQSCNGSLIDPNPVSGIHTYTIVDGSDNSRLERITVTILDFTANVPGGGGSVILCSGINFTGNCQTFDVTQIIPDLMTQPIGDNTVSSLKVINLGRIYLCQDTNYAGVCEGFGSGNYPDLSSYAIGIGTASSMFEAPVMNRVFVCSDINFGGMCETFSIDDTNLIDNQIGDNTVSSIYIDTYPWRNMQLCQDINFGGNCQTFTGGTYYPNLANQPIGDNQTSSIKF